MVGLDSDQLVFVNSFVTRNAWNVAVSFPARISVVLIRDGGSLNHVQISSWRASTNGKGGD